MQSRITLAFVVLSISGGLLYWAWTMANAERAAPPPLTEEEVGPGVRLLSFDELASFEFDYSPKESSADDAERIPAKIRALDGETVAIEGYFYSVLDDEDRVTGGQLQRYVAACCFGQPCLITEIAWVTLKHPKELPFAYDSLVLVRGTFHAKVVRNHFGYVEHLYEIDADAIEDRSADMAK